MFVAPTTLVQRAAKYVHHTRFRSECPWYCHHLHILKLTFKLLLEIYDVIAIDSLDYRFSVLLVLKFTPLKWTTTLKTLYFGNHCKIKQAQIYPHIIWANLGDSALQTLSICSHGWWCPADMLICQTSSDVPALMLFTLLSLSLVQWS